MSENALLDRHAHTRTFSLPFFDDAETPNDHWLFEGTWGRESEPEYPGSAQELMGTVYHDSPNPNDPESKTLYAHLSNMALRLDGEIDLSGTASAVLTYWDKRDLGAGDRAYVELSTDGGFTWTAIHMEHHDAAAWQAHSLDLSRYAALPAPHNRIVIRFRLDARSDTATGDGWYIDAIRVDG